MSNLSRRQKRGPVQSGDPLFEPRPNVPRRRVRGMDDELAPEPGTIAGPLGDVDPSAA